MVEIALFRSDAEIDAGWLNPTRQAPLPLDLPLDRPRSPGQPFQGATCDIAIAAENCSKIVQFSSRSECSLLATLAAGFYALLHRLTAQSDIAVIIDAADQSRRDEAEYRTAKLNQFLLLLAVGEG